MRAELKITPAINKIVIKSDELVYLSFSFISLRNPAIWKHADAQKLTNLS